ncbi:hypothetical protein [Burkholderia pseudomultivorans]|uniref:hypothetical protein n=1 Tax=Burkholderia pseudomultivorans TaxID=1207504 RepID=UPI00188F0C32|nr:hypothetical protein [Burkholderia pseudomultivorans]MBF5008681.1 hypothetical protein [Burkholderia pseudomultivorans]
MSRLQRWLGDWINRPYARALTRRLGPFVDRRVFPALAGFIAFGATVTMSVPLSPVVAAMVALKPARWQSIAASAVVGSAAGATLLTYVIQSVSVPWLDAGMPELMRSRHWLHLTEWVSHAGLWALAGVAASPLSQTPALALAGMLGMPMWQVFLAVALGKSAKYGVIGYATSTAFRSTSGPAATSRPLDERERM